MRIEGLKIKIFADGADLAGMIEMAQNPIIRGFTCNPTLMRKAGVKDYKEFAREVLSTIQDRPISFEVIADDFQEMERQALEIASWGNNVVVKIPIINTKGNSCGCVIQNLVEKGVRVNITAVMSLPQILRSAAYLENTKDSYVSVFAGRIADSGLDPVHSVQAAVGFVKYNPGIKVIWASPREIFNLFQAESVGCHVITMTNDLIKKLSVVGKDLNKFSLETVSMFYQDAVESGYSI